MNPSMALRASDRLLSLTRRFTVATCIAGAVLAPGRSRTATSRGIDPRHEAVSWPPWVDAFMPTQPACLIWPSRTRANSDALLAQCGVAAVKPMRNERTAVAPRGSAAAHRRTSKGLCTFYQGSMTCGTMAPSDTRIRALHERDGR